jgi:hypothetical protein
MDVHSSNNPAIIKGAFCLKTPFKYVERGT